MRHPLSAVVPGLPSLSSLTWGQVGDWLAGTPLVILLVVVLAFVVRWLLNRVIGRLVATATSRRTERLASLPGAGRAVAGLTGVGTQRHVQRAETMGSLLRSIVTFLVFGIAALTVLDKLGVPLGPALTSAGVGGVALAFGAQSLVKDFLSGVFMIVEDQYGVGDVIDTGEAVGTVENVSLRVTRLRDANGVTWYVRNGEIVRIGNRSQGWSTAIVDVAIAIDEDAERAMRVIRDVVSVLDDGPPLAEKLLEEPEVVGIESIAGGAVTIRVTAKTVSQEHFAVQREMRERIKNALDVAGVRTPPVVGLPPFTPGTGGPGGPGATGGPR
ncbi:small conductance mechanosensitive channel [Terracoccus luteus]|uniref:Small conductance mechanosensitive channel n=1 Tax=Terracoccus luteus TaxID=53356 RepID=A0A495XW49_9MICO|nr:mechanosensitive ion channel family protein [Terracoccus luteus]RKT77044.1 small conductance mechanosensitive channel [Terracoccus luteus]